MVFLRFKKINGKKYWYFVENYYDKGRVKQRIVLWVGNTEKLFNYLRSGLVSVNNIEIGKVKDYGAVVSLHELFQELNLINKINELMPKRSSNWVDIGRLTEIMVINRLIAQKSNNSIRSWYKNTILPDLLKLPEDKLYSQLFYRALDHFTEDSIEKLEKYLIKTAQIKFGIEIRQVFYDITSFYLEGATCELAEFGYSRDHRPDKKQIVFGLVILPTNKFPILYKIYRGNTADVSTTIEIMEKIKRLYEIEDFTSIIDRGMISDKVRLELFKNNIKYISSLDSNSNELKDLIKIVSRKSFRKIILNNGRIVYARGITGCIKELRKRYNIKNKSKRKFRELDEVRFKYIIGKSPEISFEKKEAFIEKLAGAIKNLKEFQDNYNLKSRNTGRGRPVNIGSRINLILNGISKYFDVNWVILNDKLKIEVKMDWKLIKTTLRNLGRFVLVSSDLNLSTKKIVQAYIDKFQIEQTFRFLKTDIKIRPFWLRKKNRVIAYFFISYLAYFLKCIIEYRLKKSRIKMSFNKVLNELGEIKIVSIIINKEKVEKISKMTTVQQKILKSLKIDITRKCQT